MGMDQREIPPGDRNYVEMPPDRAGGADLSAIVRNIDPEASDMTDSAPSIVMDDNLAPDVEGAGRLAFRDGNVEVPDF